MSDPEVRIGLPIDFPCTLHEEVFPRNRPISTVNAQLIRGFRETVRRRRGCGPQEDPYNHESHRDARDSSYHFTSPRWAGLGYFYRAPPRRPVGRDSNVS